MNDVDTNNNTVPIQKKDKVIRKRKVKPENKPENKNSIQTNALANDKN